jgi:hypothetical protein
MLMLEDLINTVDLNALEERSSFAERRAIAEVFAGRINDILEDREICSFEDNFHDEIEDSPSDLENNGYMALGEMLNKSQVIETLDHFHQSLCYNAHVVAKSDNVGRTFETGADKFPFGSYQQEDVIAAPYLLELANDPRVLARVARYLGCTPSLYSMNAWWSFPGQTSPDLLGQGIHRDEDDFKNCVLFLYLTDAKADTGAHEYLRGTHRQDLVREMLANTSFPIVEIEKNGTQEKVIVEFEALFTGAGYDGDPVYKSLFGEQFDVIEGKPGSAFLSDTTGLHHGRPPKRDARLLVWIRYGLYRNRAYRNDKLVPVNYDWTTGRVVDDRRHHYINRLLLDGDRGSNNYR